MGRRLLVLLLSTIVAALPQAVYALGLGEITLKSALNQPLKAEIKLLQVRDLNETEILVGLASAEEFERVGVDRPYFLTNLDFTVELNTANGPVIVVTSKKPVREPYLNFVLQAQWPSGKLLREYTLLMDLPVFSDQQAPPVTAVQTEPSTQQTSQAQPQTPSRKPGYNPRSSYDEAPARPSVTQQQAPRSVSSQRQTESVQYQPSAESYGPVQANETLWQIAQQVRPDRSVSIQQTMLAIQRLNPDAFINNNINLLRKGQILRVPDRQQIAENSKRDAIQEVAQQNVQWSGDPNGGFGDARGAQLDAGRASVDSDQRTSQVEGRVKLTSPEDVTGTESGRGAGAGASSLDALENELAITLEQLDKSERENSDIKSHVEALNEQISTQERMLEIRNKELAELEMAIHKSREQEAMALAAEEQRKEEALAQANAETGDQQASAADETDEEEQADIAMVQPTDEAVEEPSPVPTPESSIDRKTTVVPSSKPAKSGVVDLLLDNLVFIAGGLFLLALGAFLFFKFRSGSEEEAGDEFLDQPFEDYKEEPLFNETPEENLDLDSEMEPMEEEPLEEMDEEYTEAPEFEGVAGEAQTEDVVAEADIYIAYGKYDQAEEMLIKALDKDPANTGIRVKLLEVFATQQDVERFDPQFARLLATEDASAKQRGHQLREGIAGAPEFDPSLYDVSDIESTGQESFSTDEYASAEYEEATDDFSDLTLDIDDEPEGATELNVEDDLEFELDLDDDVEVEGADIGEAEDDDLSFELDLDTEEFDNSLDTEQALQDEEELSLDLPDEDEELEPVSEVQADSEVDIELDVEDFDLDFESDAAGEVDEEEESLDLDNLSLDYESEELSLDTLPEDSAEEEESVTGDTLSMEAVGDFDLDAELENLDDSFDVSADLDELDSDDASEQASSEESLDLDEDGLDLSALDKELDDLTSGLSVEGADVNDLELALGDDFSDSGDAYDDLEAGLDSEPESPTVMVEPVTDFDDFEDELESDLNADEEASDEDQPEVSVSEPDEDASADTDEDELFEKALNGTDDLAFDIPDIDPAADDDDDLGFLSDSDETATKLDLARAYIDMGDAEGAKDILDEIIKEGNSQQKQEAESLLARV